ncbi:MAG: UDP-N-acetylglucosamine 2-epimerase (non-hydrolyzing) [Bacteroidia bacterium]|nr:UDP-N-acetylglucosamine 2-epimerase (non-hydrolyzing) [Bacteroidia bacterium]
MKILIVVGTRPNFIKVTQFAREFGRFPGEFDFRILHTGQHYDDKMSTVFFQQFGLEPDFFLEIPPGSPNSQTAEIMLRLEKVVNESFRPDLMIVPGDVNSTLAASLAAHKLGIPLAHLESGLRSFDRTMPEEINRILTDEVADWYFITEQSGLNHLRREGKEEKRLLMMGNTMIDTMVAFEKEISASQICTELGVSKGNFALMTMHRPATVDDPEEMEKLMEVIRAITAQMHLVFPVHPRTLKQAEKFGLGAELHQMNHLVLTEPLSYFDFQKLVADCAFGITDSGGIQEETTFRQIPCLTLRPNTERPITVTLGTNTLLPMDPPLILNHIDQILKGTYKKGEIPPLWDGKATQRIVEWLRKGEF